MEFLHTNLAEEAEEILASVTTSLGLDDFEFSDGFSEEDLAPSISDFSDPFYVGE